MVFPFNKSNLSIVFSYNFSILDNALLHWHNKMLQHESMQLLKDIVNIQGKNKYMFYFLLKIVKQRQILSRNATGQYLSYSPVAWNSV